MLDESTLLIKERHMSSKHRHSLTSPSGIKPPVGYDSCTPLLRSYISKRLIDIQQTKSQLVSLQSKIQMKRRRLVQNLIHIFRLRKVSRNTKGITIIEYRILHCSIPPLESLHSLPPKQWFKLNSCIGYCIHMMLLLSQYLNIELPFPIQVYPPAISHATGYF